MTWTKIDDQFHGHPKVVRAWDQEPISIGLHLLALSHCAAYLTDGEVTEAYVKSKLPSPARRRRAIAALVENGLWDQLCSGLWVIHDYLEFNESRESVLERRAQRSQTSADAGRTGAAKRWGDPLVRRMANNRKLACSPSGEPIAPTPYPFPDPLAS